MASACYHIRRRAQGVRVAQDCCVASRIFDTTCTQRVIIIWHPNNEQPAAAAHRLGARNLCAMLRILVLWRRSNDTRYGGVTDRARTGDSTAPDNNDFVRMPFMQPPRWTAGAGQHRLGSEVNGPGVLALGVGRWIEARGWRREKFGRTRTRRQTVGGVRQMGISSSPAGEEIEGARVMMMVLISFVGSTGSILSLRFSGTGPWRRPGSLAGGRARTHARTD